jgi:peptide/nickel transport system permease protein
MGFQFVWLWTDVALWLLAVALVGYGLRVTRAPQQRATWGKVLRDPAALSSSLVLVLFLGVAGLDSVHFRRAVPAAASQAAGTDFYDSRVESLLDLALARQLAMRESSYSAPLATLEFSKQAMVVDGKAVRDHPRLVHGGAHLKDPARDWAGDVAARAGQGAAAGAVLVLLASALVAWGLRRSHGGTAAAWRAIAADRTALPLRALLLTAAAVAVVCGMVAALMDHYHVFGTDLTGNDVLVKLLKSVRTAFVIGTLSTLAMLPLAVTLGILGGYFRGWVDEVVQYLYTLLSSVPSVLLIAACVLMVQVGLDKHPEWFETGAERSDLKMFMLCAILGLTGWATLCRLVRAETLKLRELEFVQAATAFGVSHVRIMARHILPNVVHLVLISTVLSFSDLILYEAVLTYVGVGVDPALNSFGGMINLARTEMSRDPVVWWSFTAAFAMMVALVLAANLFADGVRDAFDPRARSLRARLLRRRAGTTSGSEAGSA